jgi:hypothetical protein
MMMKIWMMKELNCCIYFPFKVNGVDFDAKRFEGPANGEKGGVEWILFERSI